jgi:hypothetical protein
MSSSPASNTLVGLASSVTQVQTGAAEEVMRRARNVLPAGLPTHLRIAAVLEEDWRSLQGSREPVISALASAMSDAKTDLLVVNILGVALATAGEDGVIELVPLLSHEVFWIRAYAAFGIGSLERTSRWAVPLLLRALDGPPSDWTAYTIIRALGTIGGRHATSALESMAGQHRHVLPPDQHLLQALEEALASARLQE